MKLYAFDIHKNRHPWRRAPAPLLELREMLAILLQKQEQYEMARQETLEQLKTKVQANTDATQAASQSLQHYAQSTAELTEKLKQALENADAADEQAVKDAVAALDRNNQELIANVPVLAQAITAGTPAAGSNPGQSAPA